MAYALLVHFRLPRSVRSIHRVQTIARVLTHHGFGHLVDKLHLGRYVPIPRRWSSKATAAAATTVPDIGERLCRVCEDLGPSFIKLGQLVSTRPDLLPADVIAALSGLQNQVPPFDSARARQIITEDLGAQIETCFYSFEDVPLASGSIAQVHQAVIRNPDGSPGERVVVKVRRPDIEDVVRLDMTILRWIADAAEMLLPEVAIYQPRTLVEEFERSILREMDLVNEAATITRFRETLGDDPCFRIPRVHWELTGTAVLTQEEIQGISLHALLDRRANSRLPPEFDAKALATRIADTFLLQFFEMGLFHADPHPGNLLIRPPASVGLIDFGLTGRMDDDMLGHLVIGLIGAFNKQPELVVEVLADMNALSDATDRVTLRREFLELIEKYYGLPLHRFEMQTLFYEFTGLIRRNHVTLPRDFVLFGKALVVMGGICLQLDPELNLLELVQPRLRGFLTHRITPARLARSAAISGWHLLNILKSAPGQLRDVSRRLARGQWQINIRHQNLDTLGHEIDRASNRLGFAVIIAAVIVGSSWVLSSSTEQKLLNLVPLQAFGVAGYLVAGVMGLWLVVAILRSGKLS